MDGSTTDKLIHVALTVSNFTKKPEHVTPNLSLDRALVAPVLSEIEKSNESVSHI